MKKEDSGLLGFGITTLLIFVYGLRTNRGWKYWLFSILFISSAGWYIGYALGKDDPNQLDKNNKLTNFYLVQAEKELCRERECKDKGGDYRNGRCEGPVDYTNGYLNFPTIELTGCK